jgi:hypothetical protein
VSVIRRVRGRRRRVNGGIDAIRGIRVNEGIGKRRKPENQPEG